MRERIFRDPESAIAHVKIDGLVQLAAIISAVCLWGMAALLLSALHMHDIVRIPQLSQALQALTLIGLAPVAVAGASYRLFRWAFATYLTIYARNHFLS